MATYHPAMFNQFFHHGMRQPIRYGKKDALYFQIALALKSCSVNAYQNSVTVNQCAA